MTERRKVEVELHAFEDIGGDEDFRIPLVDAIDSLTKALNAIPAEHRETAVFRIWGSGEYVSVYPEVRYTRPETDGELAARVAWDDRHKRDNEERDRQEFERLKRKFATNA